MQGGTGGDTDDRDGTNPSQNKTTNKAPNNNSNNNNNDDPWIHLVEPKDFSRLLYPNPVCFLCTPCPSSSDPPGGDGDDDDDDGKNNKKNTNKNLQAYSYPGNVMTISWLTPINNNGCFVMSLNRKRFSAQYFHSMGTITTATTTTSLSSTSTRPGTTSTERSNTMVGLDFCLCVPIAGMESLILAVGGTSGRLGTKFPRHDNNDDKKNEQEVEEQGNPDFQSMSRKGTCSSSSSHSTMSQRRKRRLEQEEWVKHGIEGLIQVPFGAHNGSSANSRPTTNAAGLFCIDGTVAHLHCRTYMIHGGSSNSTADDPDHVDFIADQDHLIIYARVMDAYCRSSYWNSHKRLFCPQRPGTRPFLTFLGSQTFGYVVDTEKTDPALATTPPGPTRK